MKKVFNFFLMSCLLATSVYFMTGCEKENDPNNSNNPNNSVPDPLGTITANIAEDNYIELNSFGLISWTPPDNLHLDGTRYADGHRVEMSICDLGSMNGLGNITTIPISGFTIPTIYNRSVACEKGHGYVIKCESYGQIIYVRLYVVEPIVSTFGGIMGAKVKYQFPFEP